MNDNSTTAAANGQLPLKLTWQSIDPSANRYRYFVLRVDEDLWGNPCVVRRWGRIGSENLRERYVWPESKVELERWVRHICRAREYHGYELVDDGSSSPSAATSRSRCQPVHDLRVAVPGCPRMLH